MVLFSFFPGYIRRREAGADSSRAFDEKLVGSDSPTCAFSRNDRSAKCQSVSASSEGVLQNDSLAICFPLNFHDPFNRFHFICFIGKKFSVSLSIPLLSRREQ